MLAIRQLSKKFYQNKTEAPVIRSLTLTVKKGEVYGFLGANGAGKTTTVKMIAGLLFPDTGTITIGKQPAGSLAAARQIGFMPENPQFYRHLNAQEVLEFVGDLFGLEKALITKRAAALLKQVGLAAMANQAVRNFSKGMHQRLAFAVALMNDPALLILDEPLDGLDPLGRLDFKRLIRQWHKDGRTIFFSSHILGDVEELCDRVGILHQGKLVAEGPPRQLAKSATLEEFFMATVRQHA